MKTEEIVKSISETLSIGNSYLTHRDEVYNKTARNQPAYISLLFPLIGAIIIALKKNILNPDGSAGQYIFNSITLLILFLPAVFYLYKQVIRILSELFLEEIIFRIWDPRYAPFKVHRDTALSVDEIKKIEDKLSKEYNVQLKFISSDKDMRLNHKSIKKALKYIREDKIVKENTIVFENNCVYGFFRNLAGGMILNLIILYTIKLLYFHNGNGNLANYIDYSCPILWIALFLFTVMAWYNRFRHIKRESIVFFVNKPQEG